eukprot:gene3839-6999_t
MEKEQVEKILTILKEENFNNIKNIYQFGSYLHDCQNEFSDKDFIVVLDEKEKYFDGNKTVEIEDYNLNIYHMIFFKFLIQQQFPDALLIFWLPKNFVFESEKLKFNLNKIKLKNQFICEASLNWNKSIKNFSNNKKNSLKNLIHCFRKIFFAFQILNAGKIYNYQEGNDIFQSIFENDNFTLKNQNENWSFFENKFKRKFRDLIHELKNFQINCKEDLSYYLKKENLSLLARDFSVNIEESLIDDNLKYISFDEDTSIEIKGIDDIRESIFDIVDEKIIFKFFHFSKKPKNIEQIYKNEDGVLIGLFYYNKKWNILIQDQISYKENFKIRKQNTKYKRTLKHHSNLEKLFWKLFNEHQYSLSDLPISYTFTFEMNLKNDHHIVQHSEYSLHLLQVCDDNSPIDLFQASKKYGFHSLKPMDIYYTELMKDLYLLDCMKLKGLFLLNENYQRFEIELPHFNMVEKLKNYELYDENSIEKFFLNLSKMNVNENFLKFNPWSNFSSDYLETKKKVMKVKNSIECIYKSIEDECPIEFGRKAKQFKFYYLLFDIRNLNGDINEYFRVIHLKKLQKIIKEMENYEKLDMSNSGQTK